MIKATYQLLLMFILVTLSVAPRFRLRHTTQKAVVDRTCPGIERITSSKCQQNQHRLICKGGFTSEWTRGARYDILHLRLDGWPGECFNIDDIQSIFPELRSLEIINCTNLHTFNGHFTSTSKIQNLTIHGLQSLLEIDPKMVEQMPELRIMDLRGNELRHLKAKLLKGPAKLEKIFLSRNQWDCSDGGLDWLAMERENSTVRQRIVDYYDLVCHQQLYRGKPLHRVMDIIWTMRRTCPSLCTCQMTHVVSDAAGNVIPLITVDCATRGLTEPPSRMPPSTTVLRLEGNKLNSISNIIHNTQYERLVDLILDNNTISTVKELEGSEWFNTFRVLSLRGNQLKQIPVYAFDKAFQVNNNIMEVYLGHNPWRCDCHFIPRFQTLLRKYKRVIKDLTDIRCPKSSDKTTSLMQISTMPLGNVCSDDVEMPISPINIVNLVLLLLILVVMGRFLYDWRSFKATGKLPWYDIAYARPASRAASNSTPIHPKNHLRRCRGEYRVSGNTDCLVTEETIKHLLLESPSVTPTREEFLGKSETMSDDCGAPSAVLCFIDELVCSPRWRRVQQQLLQSSLAEKLETAAAHTMGPSKRPVTR